MQCQPSRVENTVGTLFSAVFRAAIKLREGNFIQFLESISLLSFFNTDSRLAQPKQGEAQQYNN